MAAQEAEVRVWREGKAGRLTLNRPAALHALNTNMCLLMTKALIAWADDPAVDMILLDHAENTRGFCAGGDVRMLAESGKSDGKQAREFFGAEYRLNALIESYQKPFISILDGVTMGGGVGISVHGSHRIATENTIFAMPEASIGLFPDVGGSWFLPRLEGELGTWLALTGARLKSRDALAAGIATHFADAGQVAKLKDALCKEGLPALQALETRADGSFSPYLQRLNACFKLGTVEAICTALERAGDDWSDTQLERIKAGSPTSLKVALAQVRRGREMQSFPDVMRMEYRVGSRVVMWPDFQEGVRAALLDKNGLPRWQPDTLEAVEPKDIDLIFSPLPGKELQMVWED
ncbi:MAG: enoyl-CoA hydratase/isomerase family protein [Martelella sp.]